MLTISKRTLVQLFALAMGGVGLALVVGVLVGSQLAERDVVEAQAVGASVPVAATDPTSAPLACELAPVASEAERAHLDELARQQRWSGGDSATNSGTIEGSQFNDGGFGDIGQQWWNVTVGGDVTNVHISGTGNIVATNDAVVALPPVEPAPAAGDQAAPTTTAAPPTTEAPTTTTAPPTSSTTPSDPPSAD